MLYLEADHRGKGCRSQEQSNKRRTGDGGHLNAKVKMPLYTDEPFGIMHDRCFDDDSGNSGFPSEAAG